MQCGKLVVVVVWTAEQWRHFMTHHGITGVPPATDRRSGAEGPPPKAWVFRARQGR